MGKKMRTVKGEVLKRVVELIPNDAEVYCGIGQFQSPVVEILKDEKQNRVLFVNQSYIDDCVDLEKTE